MSSTKELLGTPLGCTVEPTTEPSSILDEETANFGKLGTDDLPSRTENWSPAFLPTGNPYLGVPMGMSENCTPAFPPTGNPFLGFQMGGTGNCPPAYPPIGNPYLGFPMGGTGNRPLVFPPTPYLGFPMGGTGNCPPAYPLTGNPYLGFSMGRTENGSPTFQTTGSPCLDFFFHIVPDTPPQSLVQRLELAWKHDSLTTLKLICNLRGVRGTGKSDKEGFYAAALWLHNNHPKTLAGNLRWFAEFGYFKDLPEILFRLLEGLEVRKIAKHESDIKKNKRQMRKGARKWRKKQKELNLNGTETRRGRGRGRFGGRRVVMNDDQALKKLEKQQKQALKASMPPEEWASMLAEKIDIMKEKARNLRKEKIVEKAKKARDWYDRDENYRFLHDQISELFAKYLTSDLQFMTTGELRKISLASKWCPSLDSSFDRSTLLCESIAKKVFPRESDPEYEGIDEAHYLYRVRDRLRKQVLVPLHRVLEIPEVYMSFNKWESLPYKRVPSVAMKNYKKIFEKHDEERFKQYLESVKRGDAKIAAGALLPHEIIKSLDEEDDATEDGCSVAELQWRRMVQDLLEKGKLRDCIAICDVSGSMMGVPMEVSVALGLLVSELSEDPWKGKVITFSRYPQLHKIEGNDLRAKTNFIRGMEMGMNTDFQRVFDLILQVAVNGKLSPEKMIKRLFVFSDMEFDQASANSWETDYEAIRRKYREHGYESSVPEIVFWNLRDSMSTPVMQEQKGVAMVSGFSKNLLTLFLEGLDPEKLNPQYVMDMAISGEEYQKLVVID